MFACKTFLQTLFSAPLILPVSGYYFTTRSDMKYSPCSTGEGRGLRWGNDLLVGLNSPPHILNSRDEADTPC